MHRALISQSNYIPWRGYFDAINACDTFVVYDDVQFTKRDWRNRNIIKTPHGPQWLTIPVNVKGKYKQKINEVQISDPTWKTDHWKTIANNYSRAPYFKMYGVLFEELYLSSNEVSLSELNFRFLQSVCNLLDIKTVFRRSSEFTVDGDPSERLLSICKALKADQYLTGPAAREYLNSQIFAENNVEIKWMDYSRYPPYSQLFGQFTPNVSILDVIFNTGANAREFICQYERH